MTQLSRELKNYYLTLDNKRVFQEKYTLNNLALEMWQRLGYRGIDASALSRIINGKRLFTVEQLTTFCTVLRLNKDARDNLFLALEEDYLHRYGLKLEPPRGSSSHIIDLFTSQLNRLYYARKHGYLQLVVDWVDELMSQTRLYAKRESNVLYKRKLLALLGDVLFEKGYVAGSMLFPEENMSIIQPLVKELLMLAKGLNSPKLAAKAYIILAFAYYALGRYSRRAQYRKFYEKSLSITKRALGIGLLSDTIALTYWRYVALNGTYLSDISVFQKAEQEIRKIVKSNLHDTHFSYITWALDSIARGQSYFGDPKAVDTVFESKKFGRKLQWRDPLREAATIRNELEVLHNLKTGDTFYKQKQAQRGLVLATDHGFFRYKKYFTNYLKGGI